LMQDAANFSSMPFKAFPPTAHRALSFSYRFPSPAAAYSPGQASGAFNYQTMLIPFTMQAPNLSGAVGVKTAAGSTGSNSKVAPVGSNNKVMSAGSLQVQSLLLSKYKLH
jgi:hypothetical protein